MSRSRSLVAAIVVAAALDACASFAPELGPIQGAPLTGGDDAGGDDAAGADAGVGDVGLEVSSADVAPSDGGGTSTDVTAPPEAAPQMWTVVVGVNGTHNFGPSTLSIRPGDTVHWVWQQSGHTVTSGTGGAADGLFCSPADTGCAGAQSSSAGATYDHVFAASGTYPYFCRLHWDSGMVGSIVVQ